MVQQIIEGFRLSPQQARVWELQKDSPAYVSRCLVDIDGPLDISRLEWSIEQVIARHEILRTTFRRLETLSVPLQVIGAAGQITVAAEDLSNLDTNEQTLHLKSAFESVDGTAVDTTLQVKLFELSTNRHVCLLSLPAMRADSLSLAKLVNEIAAVYEGAVMSSEPTQYIQISEWLNELLAEQEGTDAKNVDLAHRVGLTLPGELSNSNGSSFAFATVEISFGPEIVAQVESLAKTYGCDSSVFWLASWQVLLWRLTAQATIVLGLTTDGRRYEEMQAALGLLARLVPFTTNFEKDLQFGELLERTREEMDRAAAKQEYFSWSTPQANGSSSQSFFDVAYEYSAAVPSRSSGEMTFSLRSQLSNIDRFKLKLSCVRQQDGLVQSCFTYDANVLQRESIIRISQYFERLVQSAVSSPEAELHDLQVLPQTEKDQLLLKFNQTIAPYPQEKCLHGLLAEQVRRTPENIAVISAGQSFTYKELDDRANQLARHLTAHGVGLESHVGVCLERSVGLIVSLMAVLKTGAAYVAMNATDPVERLTYMLSDADVSVLLIGANSTREWPEMDVRVIDVNKDWDEISRLSSEPVLSSVTSENLAYVLYTSGSSGLPKGTLITHRGLVNYLHWAISAYQVADGEGAPLHSPIAFDLTVTSVFTPLLTGRPIVLLPAASGVDELADTLVAHPGFSLVKLTPAHLAILNEQFSETAQASEVKFLIVGGEALVAESLQLWRTQSPGTRIINEYGPTETVVGCCVYEVSPEDAQVGPVPIGTPIANTDLYILDEKFEPLPIGVTGELFIGGDGLARGYNKRPDLTAEKFIPHPFSQTGGQRLYRSGDVARYRADGVIEYLGRKDDQVKILGYRIELSEIESVMRQHESVQDAVVLALPDAHGEKRLVGYVVSGGTFSAEEMRRFLFGKLPDYMVPRTFVRLETLPLARSGKVDRKALPAPDQVEVVPGSQFVAPRTLIEEVLVTIWSEVLRIEGIGIDNNFFALGGDSIRSIQVRVRARQRGINISHQQLFQHQTIRELAQAVGFGDAVDEPVTTRPFSLISDSDRAKLPAGVDDAYPLSMLQAGMLFHSELDPEAAVFHDLHSFHLQVRFERPLLQQAIQQLAQVHSALRTSFDLRTYSEPLQLVHTDVLIPIEEEDLRHLSEEDVAITVAATLEEEKKRKFEWETAPLLRLRIQHRSEDSCQFVLSFHHSVLDGWSAATLLTELFNLYSTLVEKRELPEPPQLATNYRDFVAMERAALSSPEHEDYWSRLLQGSKFLELPRLQASESDEQSPGGNVHQVRFSEELSQQLRRLAQSASVPLKSLLLAAHLKVMSVLGGDRDVLTALISNGRPEEADGDRMLGLFLNTLPFRMKLRNGSWNELIRETFEVERQQLPFRRYPLAELQRRQGGHPLFETAFNYMHFHVYQNLAQASDVTVVDYVGFEETDFPLMTNFVLEPATSLIQLYLNYQPKELSYSQVKTIGEYYDECLKTLVADADQQHQATRLLMPAEEEQLASWNETSASYPAEASYAELFAAQVKRTPGALAVKDGAEELTYAELDERATRLAWELRAQGVGAETIVPLLMERGVGLLTSILAVFKAGAAYLPLDPQYPGTRLGQIIRSSRAELVLASREYMGRVEEALAGTEQVKVVALEELLKRGGKATELPVPSGGQSLAYVIYTSGSTGVPKGVMIEQQGMVNHLYAKLADLQLVAEDVVAETASQCFDISVWQFLAALLVGGRVLVVSEEEAQDPLALAARVAAEGVTILEVVPSLLRALLGEEAAVRDLSGLRYLLTTGEALGPELARDWVERQGSIPLLNAYGPTECSDDVTHHVVSSVEASSGSTRIAIGRALANTQLYVLAGEGERVPVGVAGELYVGGDGVGRGYWDDAWQTAERFIPDGYGKRAGGRLYRTGDLAKYQADGTIDFLGRVDHQVKVRGFRIELGEIESVLVTHPSIKEAVVVAAETANVARLVAYIVFAAEPVPTPELREFIKQQLPDYMTPSIFISLPAMPLTPNGKIDRKALPDANAAASEMAERTYLAPQTPTEQEVANVWTEVLRVERVGSTDNFFDLGGHSLLATQVISRLRRMFAIEIPLRHVFEAPTVALLSARIELAKASAGDHPEIRLQTIPRRGRPIIKRRETKTIDELLLDLEEVTQDEAQELVESQSDVLVELETHPLSYSQEKIWEDVKINKDATMSQAIRLTGAVSIPALQLCFQTILDRHESLRSRFTNIDGRPVQTVEPKVTLGPMPVADLTSLSRTVREAEVQRVMAREVRTLFELSDTPQLRVSLLKLDAQEHVLLTTMPMIISDAWSIGVLIREMSALYPAFLNGQPSPLPELPIQLADYAHWEREWLEGEAFEELANYWRDNLGGELPVLDLPTDRPRPAQLSLRGASEPLTLNESLMDSLKVLGRQEEVTLFMLMLAAFKAFLFCYSRQDDIIVGIPAAGRNWVETEPLIGSFANTLVIRTDLSGQPSFRELLQRERRVMLDAYAHQQMPFSKLIDMLQAGGGMKEALPYRVMFDLVVAENMVQGDELPGDLQVATMEEEIVAGTLSVGNYLTFVLQEVGPELVTFLRYKVDLFDAPTIVKMLGQFQQMLQEIVEYPDRELTQLVTYLISERPPTER